MSNLLITETDPRIKEIQVKISRIRRCLSTMQQNQIRRIFNNESYITDEEIRKKLKVSRRTTQQWRNTGIVPYTLIGGKVLYKESNVHKMLEQHSFDKSKR